MTVSTVKPVDQSIEYFNLEFYFLFSLFFVWYFGNKKVFLLYSRLAEHSDLHLQCKMIKTDSAQSSSNKCKNYLLKVYSQHINVLNSF